MSPQEHTLACDRTHTGIIGTAITIFIDLTTSARALMIHSSIADSTRTFDIITDFTGTSSIMGHARFRTGIAMDLAAAFTTAVGVPAFRFSSVAVSDASSA